MSCVAGARAIIIRVSACSHAPVLLEGSVERDGLAVIYVIYHTAEAHSWFMGIVSLSHLGLRLVSRLVRCCSSCARQLLELLMPQYLIRDIAAVRMCSAEQSNRLIHRELIERIDRERVTCNPGCGI